MAYVNTLFNKNFLEYASYVIKDRAIPNIEDGLKPVQRRILHSLLEMDDGKFHKVANVVGHCMKYHPHGDASIYSALVVIANKELLIDKQGNFGNIFTGDVASAARYIECRALPFAKEILYKPEITEYEDSYDGRNKEPVTFPAKIPLLLIHGAEGIAVGMATKILPHNFKEVMEALKLALKGESFQLYPDFPTGGTLDVSDYQDGLGKVLCRAKIDASDPKRIVIRDIPFGTTTESLISSIENAARRNKIKIASISDFTTENVEIEIKLPRGVYTDDLVDALYAFTDCEVSISCNLLVIKDNLPTIVTVTDVINFHAKQLVEILTKELKLEEQQLKDRLHMRALEQIFIEERIYKRIEDQKTSEAVTASVISGFKPFANVIKREVTIEDVERLLKIPIRRISLYDINKAQKEIREIKGRLKQIREHLKNIIDYATSVVDRLIDKGPKDQKRMTILKSFEKVDVREVAARDQKLRYDENTGYIGYSITTGNVLFDVSHYDRILVIRKDCSYSVINVPEKLFIGKGVLHCCLADKEILTETVFSIIYKNVSNNYFYIKRCRIEQFILDKNYELLPEDGKFHKMTTKEDVALRVNYKQKRLIRVTEEDKSISEFLVKGVKAAGTRISNKEIQSVRFIKEK
ncbi:DNA topoisomerase IV subunit A [Spirochaeta cellobiosiphila]|uniref:DNA topoisomerase IV subunit A n=1 Tax=Spirochaeta cellobiosiphila TaxID=504483 RepID=UPI00041251B4|nr:DNA topoisomerase IV subunit A [Spirochaeta cellobiosiphila]